MKIECIKMRFKCALLILAAIFFTNIINAQNNLDKITGLSSTSASVAYSLRQLSSSYTGPLVRIKVGTSFYDVYPDASTTKFSLSSKISAPISTYNAAVAAASANELSTVISGSTDATLAIWYDQSGNGIHVYSSSATAKIITLGSIITMNGQPTITFVANSTFTSTSTVNYSAQTAATINAVAQNINSTSDYSGIISTGPNGGWGLSYNPSNVNQPGFGSDKFYGYFVDGNGGLNASSKELTTTPSIITGLVNKSAVTSSLYINSISKNSTTQLRNPGNGTADLIYVGKRGNCCADRIFLGNISETFIFNKILSTAEQTALETSQAIFLPPTVTITSSASGAVCAGTNVTFTASISGFTNPYYQWYANGTPISGATSATYSTNSLVNGDQVNVKVNEGPFGGAVTSNGLLLNLDATNPSSYSGSGTTWNNLVTGNEVTNFTLSAGGAYSTDNGGVIRFGNTGGGASSSTGFSNLSAYTVEVWVKPAGTMGGYDPSVEANYTPSFFAEKSSASRVNMVLAYNARGLTSGTANNSYRYEAAINYGGWKKYQIPTDYSSDLNNWVQIISSYNGSTLTIYRNGVSLGTSPALAIPSLRTPSTGYWIAHRWDMIDAVYGDYSKVMMYDRALSPAEVSANYSAFNARFVDNSVSSSAITTTVNASPAVPVLTVLGDGCINKTSLSTPAGLTSYAWYKDNVVISGATSNTYTPSGSGVYQVTVSNGTCSNTSTSTTIYTCGRTADGKMSPITSSTALVTITGEINSKYGVDERGLLLTKPFANTPTSANPVTSGLILYLDATRSASYGGTGNTWADISGLSPAGSATLVGSPVFASGSTANGSGSFTFGSNINASTTKTYTIDNEITYIAWVNPSTNFDGGVIVRRTDPGFGSGATSLYLYNNNLGYDWDNQNWGWRSNLTVPNNQWSMIVISVNAGSVTAYLCNASGIASVSSGRGHSSLTSKGATNFYIAYDPYSPSARALKGKMGTAMVYSVALSAADISSIYNAQKVAFGL